MGFGSDGHNAEVRTGFRANSNNSGTTAAHDWMHLPPNIEAVAKRLQGVVIENRPALDVMAAHDGIEALHYCDPPYMPITRSAKSKRGKIRYHAYSHEMSEADHADMLAFLRTLKGAVVLSGYPSELYDDSLGDWARFDKSSLADGARPRVEVLWLNQAAATNYQQRLPL